MAADVRWINPAGGEWGAGSNWDGGVVPGIGDTAIFDLESSYQINVDSDASVGGMKIFAGTVTLELNQFSLVLAAQPVVEPPPTENPNLVVQSQDGVPATLIVRNGSIEQVGGNWFVDGTTTTTANLRLESVGADTHLLNCGPHGVINMLFSVLATGGTTLCEFSSCTGTVIISGELEAFVSGLGVKEMICDGTAFFGDSGLFIQNDFVGSASASVVVCGTQSTIERALGATTWFVESGSLRVCTLFEGDVVAHGGFFELAGWPNTRMDAIMRCFGEVTCELRDQVSGSILVEETGFTQSTLDINELRVGTISAERILYGGTLGHSSMGPTRVSVDFLDWTQSSLFDSVEATTTEVFIARGGALSLLDFGPIPVLSIPVPTTFRGIPTSGFPSESGSLNLDIGQLLDVSGAVTLGGALSVPSSLVDLTTVEPGDRFPIVLAPSIIGRFGVASVPSIPLGPNGEQFFFTLEYPDPIAVQDAAERGITVSVDLVVQSGGEDVSLTEETQFNVNGVPVDAALSDVGSELTENVFGPPDGFLDLIMALPDQVVILYNAGLDGGGNWLGFSGQVIIDTFATEAQTTAVASTNVDNDKWDDLLATRSFDSGNGELLLFSNDIQGFSSGAPPQSLGVGQQPSDIAVGDFDGSLGPDVAVTNKGDDTVSIFINDGSGLVADGTLATGQEPCSVIIDQLQDDKWDDLVIVNRGDGTVTIYAGAGPGAAAAGTGAWTGAGTGAALFSFGPRIDIGVGANPTQVITADLDGNGFPEILTANTPAPSFPSATVSIITNYNSFQFSPANELAIFQRSAASDEDDRTGVKSIGTLDLDGDGDLDLVAVVDVEVEELNGQGEPTGNKLRTANEMRSMQNNGSITFANAEERPAPPDPQLVCTGRFKLDLVNLVGDPQEHFITLNTGEANPLAAQTEGAPALINQVSPFTVSACAGDASGDGQVNFADITSVLANWLVDPPYTPLTGPGDANKDGQVNFADITSVLSNWLSNCP